MALPVNELKIKIIVDYESGKLIFADKLVAEIEAMKREIENLKAMIGVSRDA
jgi:hypothetical protein